MEQWLSPEAWIDLGNRVWAWVQQDVLVPSTGIQIAAIAVAFGLSFLLARLTRGWLTERISNPTFGKAISILLPLWMPLIWGLLQWISMAAATTLEWPSRLLDSITGLIFAWIAIRLISQVVRNPLLATVFVWTAWTIAALNILDWVDNVVATLQSAVLITLSSGANGEPNVISLYTLVRWTFLVFILMWVAVYLSSFLESRIKTIRTLSPSLQVLFIKALKIVLFSLAIIFAIDSVGIDLTALAVFGGAIGVGVGFGLQKIVSNLISGVILLLDKSIKPGDVIAVSGTYGWVTALGGRYVSVVTRDGVEHLIPNEMLISERVENWTHTHSRTRLKVDVGVHYQTDIHEAIAICLSAAQEIERVLSDPEPKVLLIEFGDNSVNLQVRFWIADAHNGVQNVKSAVLLSIWDKFKAAGIEIPYPQRDLHLRSGFESLKPGD